VVCVLEVRWDIVGTVKTDQYTFIYVKRNENLKLGTGFFVHHRILSAVKTAQSVPDRTSCIVLRGSWCDTISLY
jgi:hypothetical protein